MRSHKVMILIIITIFFSVFIISCDKIEQITGKKDTKAIEKAEGSEEAASISVRKENIEAGSGVVMEDITLWSSLGEDRARVAVLSKGEAVELSGETDYRPTDKNKTYAYYKVKRSDGSEGWVHSYYVAPSSTVGVITKETDFYSAPAELISKGSLSAFTIIGISTEPEKSGKHKIYYFHNYGDWGQVESVWVSGNYSDRQDDLVFWAKYTEAKTKYQDDKKELYTALTEVLSDFQSKPVTADLVDSLNKELDELSQSLMAEPKTMENTETSSENSGQ
ncbi:hypothetical protein WKV44_07655 [Spirochaetia bacterium 38H-sp]|uniref:SH3 domain-containing protein n=1 Tax=Rarispira pelagica TaxID=3141764 RepID=A0ABU9UCN0_9SPIR